MKKQIKAYKVFNEDWKCLNKKYKVGRIEKIKGDLKICENGMHFCIKLANCFNYYEFNPRNKVAEVLIMGDVINDESDKGCTNKLKVLREVSWQEVLNIVNSGHGNSGHSNSGDCNSGHGNSGYRNSGHSNSGDRNSGDSNSGDRNSGDYNSGDCNSGHGNSGYRNSGDSNSGDRNSGHSNSGHSNSGDSNSGDRNSGDYNSGDCNSGHGNSGYRNSGHSNSGCRNSGDRNSGDYNSGYRNSGDYNSGDYNSGDRNSGMFNTNEEKIRIFNKRTRYTMDSFYKKYEIPKCLLFDVTEAVDYKRMTKVEKMNNPHIKKDDIFVRKLEYKDAFRKSMKKATNEEIDMIKRLPNFDADIFYEISGFRIK